MPITLPFSLTMPAMSFIAPLGLVRAQDRRGRHAGDDSINEAADALLTVALEQAGERLQILAETDGVARCHTAYNCTEACPREIKITKAIGEVKLAIITGKLD